MADRKVELGKGGMQSFALRRHYRWHWNYILTEHTPGCSTFSFSCLHNNNALCVHTADFPIEYATWSTFLMYSMKIISLLFAQHDNLGGHVVLLSTED